MSRGGTSDSTAAAARRTAPSPSAGPISCNPTGIPSSIPHGTETDGIPARLDGPTRRISSASRSRVTPPTSTEVSPIRGVRIGSVGEAITSTSAKARANSARTSDRICWART